MRPQAEKTMLDAWDNRMKAFNENARRLMAQLKTAPLEVKECIKLYPGPWFKSFIPQDPVTKRFLLSQAMINIQGNDLPFIEVLLMAASKQGIPSSVPIVLINLFTNTLVKAGERVDRFRVVTADDWSQQVDGHIHALFQQRAPLSLMEVADEDYEAIRQMFQAP